MRSAGASSRRPSGVNQRALRPPRCLNTYACAARGRAASRARPLRSAAGAGCRQPTRVSDAYDHRCTHQTPLYGSAQPCVTPHCASQHTRLCRAVRRRPCSHGYFDHPATSRRRPGSCAPVARALRARTRSRQAPRRRGWAGLSQAPVAAGSKSHSGRVGWGRAGSGLGRPARLVVEVLLVGRARVQRLPLDAQDGLDLVRAHVPAAVQAPPREQRAVAAAARPRRVRVRRARRLRGGGVRARAQAGPAARWLRLASPEARTATPKSIPP